MYTIKIDNDHKKKHHVYGMTAMLFILFLSSVNIASARYEFDGFPSTDQLVNVVHDSVIGGVFVDGGLDNPKNSPYYTQSFSIPNGQINYSRLYVGVWGGTETNTGTLQTTINDHEFDSIYLEGEDDTNENVYCSGHGVYWVTYNSTKYTTSGLNSAIARTSGTIDGRVYSIILVAVYADNTSEQNVEYWINEGNPNLYSSSDSHPSGNKEAHAYFSGINNIHPPAARLSVVYLAGNEGQNDYLYFNDNKLNGDDVATSSSSDYFDLLTFDVTDYLESSSNARFDVGDESYLHPVLAVLTVYTGDLEEESDLIVKKVAVGELCTNNENVISANIENIGTSHAFGFSAALYSDDIMVSKAQVSSIGPDKNISVNFTWEPIYTGQHNLRVMVDYTDLVAELRETNNNNTPFTVDILDHTPPNITIDQPQYDQTFTYQTITAKGTIEDVDKNITMVVNGIDTVCSGGKWSVLIPVDEGMNKIIVNAIDGSNNTATEFVIINGDFNGSGQQSIVGTDLHNNSIINDNSSTHGNDSSMYTTNCPGAVTLLCLLLVIYLIRRAI